MYSHYGLHSQINVLPGYVILECIYIRISVNLLFSIVNYIPFISIGGIVYIITLSVIISFVSLS